MTTKDTTTWGRHLDTADTIAKIEETFKMCPWCGFRLCLSEFWSDKMRAYTTDCNDCRPKERKR